MNYSTPPTSELPLPVLLVVGVRACGGTVTVRRIPLLFNYLHQLNPVECYGNICVDS